MDPAQTTSSYNGIRTSCITEARLELQHCTHDMSFLSSFKAIHSMVEEPKK